MTDWTTVAKTKVHLGLGVSDTVDEYWLDRCVKAANQYVDDTRAGPVPAGGWTVDDRTALGADMLAARWYSRRNSGDGSAQYVEMGGAAPVIDRDVEMQLQTGRYFGPVVC